MSDFEFDLDGIDELAADIKQCLKEYPEETSKKIYNLAGKFTKDVNAKFPTDYSTGKRSLPKSWKREREKTLFTGYTVRVNISNKAPHFHLIENGHMKVIAPQAYAMHLKREQRSAESTRKRPKKIRGAKFKTESRGFVPGKHYCEKTRNEWQEKFPQEVEKFVDKMLKDRRL